MIPPTHNPTWPDDVQALYRHDMQEIWDQRLAPQIWNQYHNQLDIYLALAGDTPLRVMDVGCAQGTLALLLAEGGHQVTAVDIRPQFLEYAKSRYSHGEIEFTAANVLEDQLPGGFDLIFANQIIEHLVYPARLLERLRDLLKPSGRLVVTTPNGQYVKNSLPSYGQLGNPAEWEHMQFSADGDGHFFAYRAAELVEIFSSVGLVAMERRFFETPFVSGHMKVRHLHALAPSAVLRAADRLMLAVPGLGRVSAHQLMVIGSRAGES